MTPSTPLTLTATVTGANNIAPTGSITLYIFDFFRDAPTPLVPGSNGTSTAVIHILASDFLQGPNSVTVTYSGDKNYLPSTSAPITSITDSNADFTVQTQSANLAVTAGSTGTATINLASMYGFNGTVSLACSAPAALTCSLASSSVSVNGTASTTLTLNAFTTRTTTASQGRTTLPWTAVSPELAGMLLLFLPKRRRRGRIVLLLLFSAVLSAGIGCSGTSTPAPPVVTTTNTNAPAGTYNVGVTGTAGSGIIHDTTITVVVQ
jgi:hypothetical protein